MMTYETWGMGIGMGIFGWILMIIFWGAIIWLIVWLISQNNNRAAEVKQDSRYRNQTPNQILDARYANGEISSNEYDEIKQNLRKQ